MLTLQPEMLSMILHCLPLLNDQFLLLLLNVLVLVLKRNYKKLPKKSLAALLHCWHMENVILIPKQQKA